MAQLVQRLPCRTLQVQVLPEAALLFLLGKRKSCLQASLLGFASSLIYMYMHNMYIHVHTHTPMQQNVHAHVHVHVHVHTLALAVAILN